MSWLARMISWRPGRNPDRAASLDGLEPAVLAQMVRDLQVRNQTLSVERAQLKAEAETANAETQIWKAALSAVYEEAKARTAAAIYSQEAAVRGVAEIVKGQPVPVRPNPPR